MKLEDMKDEFAEFCEDVKDKTRAATVNYHGDMASYKANRNKALVGVGVSVLTYPFLPLVSFIALGYSGVKAYQAYKDQKNNER